MTELTIPEILLLLNLTSAEIQRADKHQSGEDVPELVTKGWRDHALNVSEIESKLYKFLSQARRDKPAIDIGKS